MSYVWIFYVEDAGLPDKIHITVIASDHKEAVTKIKAMKIPYLLSWNDINTALNLEEVYEVEPEDEGEHHII